MELTAQAKKIIELFTDNGRQIYAVGGAVRDFLMKRKSDDIDFATDALPVQTMEILKSASIAYYETGLQHGTVTAVVDGVPFEITTFRKDGEYNDSRHPENVDFLPSIEGDLARRDFTVNALAYSSESGIIDLFGGLDDINNKLIRTVGDADKRFSEDALRILRALRFSSVLGFEVEERTSESILKNKELLKNVSVERIFSEFSKLLCGKNAYNVLQKYKSVFATFIPEINDSIGFPQHNKYHIYDVYTHICKSVESAPKTLEIRLALYFHDLGKPFCKTTDCDMTDHFYGHPAISSELCEKALRRLKCKSSLISDVTQLIYYHDSTVSPTKKNIKRWLSKIGEIQLKRLIDVKISDMKAHNPDLVYEAIERLESIKPIIDEVLYENECFSVKDLAVNGNDLINLGYKGKEIGLELSYLLDLVIDEKAENTREALLKVLKERGAE